MRKQIRIVSKLVALFGGVINVSQGKIMYQAELEFHVKQPTFQLTIQQPKRHLNDFETQTGHNSQKML